MLQNAPGGQVTQVTPSGSKYEPGRHNGLAKQLPELSHQPGLHAAHVVGLSDLQQVQLATLHAKLVAPGGHMPVKFMLTGGTMAGDGVMAVK